MLGGCHDNQTKRDGFHVSVYFITTFWVKTVVVRSHNGAKQKRLRGVGSPDLLQPLQRGCTWFPLRHRSGAVQQRTDILNSGKRERNVRFPGGVRLVHAVPPCFVLRGGCGASHTPRLV